MSIPPSIETITRFLRPFEEGEPPSIEELAAALDTLAVAYHRAPICAPADENLEPPAKDYQAIYAKLCALYPSLGFYACADPLEVHENQSRVGDAIDDLADIIGDLEEVAWRFEHSGADDAHWHLRFLFEVHWGLHLRNLSLYLHTVLHSG